jgi:glyoxylase-like metal-dependent hydrolase (beta-lactamase superfamily II)
VSDEILAELGVRRVPVPIPFPEAGGPVNIYVIDERDGGLALFDAGLGTREGRDAIEKGFADAGLSLGDVRRIFISHGHIDHYGYARAIQEVSGATVFAHARDHDKLTGRARTAERLERYRDYLLRLGAPAELMGHVETHWMDNQRMARPIEDVQPLQPNEKLHFAKFEAEVLHLPGHTPGLVCLWAAAQRVLFSDDHLLERVSPNPLVDLEGHKEPVHRALVEYLRSIQKVRDMPVSAVMPGHAAPFAGHAEIIDRLLSFYELRQQKLLALLAGGPRTPAELSALLFPRAKPHQLYLTLSETFGNLEVLEDRGLLHRQEHEGRIRFEAA